MSVGIEVPCTTAKPSNNSTQPATSSHSHRLLGINQTSMLKDPSPSVGSLIEPRLTPLNLGRDSPCSARGLRRSSRDKATYETAPIGACSAVVDSKLVCPPFPACHLSGFSPIRPSRAAGVVRAGFRAGLPRARFPFACPRRPAHVLQVLVWPPPCRARPPSRTPSAANSCDSRPASSRLPLRTPPRLRRIRGDRLDAQLPHRPPEPRRFDFVHPVAGLRRAPVVAAASVHRLPNGPRRSIVSRTPRRLDQGVLLVHEEPSSRHDQVPVLGLFWMRRRHGVSTSAQAPRIGLDSAPSGRSVLPVARILATTFEGEQPNGRKRSRSGGQHPHGAGQVASRQLQSHALR